MNELLRSIVENDSIPSPPAIAIRLLDLVSQPTTSLGDIIEVVSADPKLAARLIDYTNSPLMGAGRVISSLQQAVIVLGLRSVRLLSLSFSLVETNKAQAFDYQTFWRNSLVTAIATKKVRQREREQADEDFLMGLVFNIGAIGIGSTHPELLEQFDGQTCLQSRSRKELESLGATRYQIGAKLLQRWNFPEHMVKVLDNYDGKDSEDSRYFYLAQLLTELVLSTETSPEEIEFVRNECAELVGITERQFDKIVNEIAKDYQSYNSLFDIQATSCLSIDELEARAKESIFKISIGLDSELKRVSEEKEILQASALIDGLTNLKNRSAYDREFPSVLEYHERQQKPAAILVIDIDHFKSINDTFGHAAGDSVLREVAQSLDISSRKYDTVYRYGGEEFAAVIVDCDQENVHLVADRFRTSVEVLELTDLPPDRRVTISIGGCWIPKDGYPCPNAFEVADQALYEAKRAGRNCSVIRTMPSLSATAAPAIDTTILPQDCSATT